METKRKRYCDVKICTNANGTKNKDFYFFRLVIFFEQIVICILLIANANYSFQPTKRSGKKRKMDF